MPADPAKVLTVKPLNDSVEDFLSAHLFTEFFANLKKDRKSPDLLDSDLLSLYNSALDQHIDTAMEVSLQEVSSSAQLFAGRRLDRSLRFLLTGMILKISTILSL